MWKCSYKLYIILKLIVGMSLTCWVIGGNPVTNMRRIYSLEFLKERSLWSFMPVLDNLFFMKIVSSERKSSEKGKHHWICKYTSSSGNKIVSRVVHYRHVELLFPFPCTGPVLYAVGKGGNSYWRELLDMKIMLSHVMSSLKCFLLANWSN